MKTSNLVLVVGLTTLFFSCSENSGKKLNSKIILNSKTITKLSPQTTKVIGVFSENVQLVDKKYDYKIKMPESDLSLPSFEMPIDFEVINQYDYDSETKKNVGNNSKYRLNLAFLDKDNYVIEHLTLSTDFEVVKYYDVNGIDFKELLTSSVGDKLSFTFKTFIKKENVRKIDKAESFKIEV